MMTQSKLCKYGVEKTTPLRVVGVVGEIQRDQHMRSDVDHLDHGRCDRDRLLGRRIITGVIDDVVSGGGWGGGGRRVIVEWVPFHGSGSEEHASLMM
jgi:hypothetical protein